MRNHFEPTKMPIIRQTITNGGKGMEGPETPNIPGRNAKWCGHFGKVCPFLKR